MHTNLLTTTTTKIKNTHIQPCIKRKVSHTHSVLAEIAIFSLWQSAQEIKLRVIYSIFGENKCFTQVSI